jgi:hypothetical protein
MGFFSVEAENPTKTQNPKPVKNSVFGGTRTFAHLWRSNLDSAIISKAPLKSLDDLSKALWFDWGSGKLTDADAEAAQKAIDSRRAVLAARTPLDAKSASRASLRRAERRFRSSNEQRLQKRRKIAACGALPASIACNFTNGELAAISIIIAEIKRNGRCTLYVGTIASHAGCCERVVQTALRHAEHLGLLKIQRRKRTGAANLSNIVTILSKELSDWVKRGCVHIVIERVQKAADNKYQFIDSLWTNQKTQIFQDLTDSERKHSFITKNKRVA